jgi:hypothetical protein
MSCSNWDLGHVMTDQHLGAHPKPAEQANAPERRFRSVFDGQSVAAVR